MMILLIFARTEEGSALGSWIFPSLLRHSLPSSTALAHFVGGRQDAPDPANCEVSEVVPSAIRGRELTQADDLRSAHGL